VLPHTGARRERIAQRIENIRLSAPLQHKQTALQRCALGETIYDFGLGELDGPISPEVKKAALASIRRERTNYAHPAGLEQLRAAVLRWLNLSHLCNPEHVVVSPGANHSLLNVMLAIGNPGDIVLLPPVHTSSYFSLATVAGLTAVSVPASKNVPYLKLTSKMLIAALQKHPRTRIFLLSNPCNPTGQLYDHLEVLEFHEICADHGVFFVLDRRFWKITFDDDPYPEPSSAAHLSPWLIQIDSLSNNFAQSAGFRVGWCVAPADISEALCIIQSHCGGGASTPSQYAATSALEHGEDEDELMELEHKRWLFSEAARSVPNTTIFPTQATFFSFWDIRRSLGTTTADGRRIQDAGDLAEFLLESYGVVVVPGTDFGQDGYIRLSFAVSDDVIRNGIPRIAEAFQELQSGGTSIRELQSE
jgi:aspartate aminotransferase